MKKALIVTTVSGFVPQFEMNNVKILQKLGYEVHYASNFKNPHYGFDNHRLKGSNIICHQVDFVRSPFSIIKNGKAYFQLKKVMKQENYNLLHCHTPMGSVLARLVGRKYQRGGLKICYTAHGFHFYKGAPWRNWLFYYPIERWLAHATDVLIVINKEDYQRACKFHLAENGFVKKINGVGIKRTEYRESEIEKNTIREGLGIEKDAFVFISVGELSKRKNHQITIKAFAQIQKTIKKNIYYLICGEGKEREALERLICRYSLSDKVKILGYQKDIRRFLNIADCFLFPSLQEGLPVALMEAMAMKLPVICSDIRGNQDLLIEEKFLIPSKDKKRYIQAMQEILLNSGARKEYPNLKFYEEQSIKKEMYQLYQKIEEIKTEVKL